MDGDHAPSRCHRGWPGSCGSRSPQEARSAIDGAGDDQRANAALSERGVSRDARNSNEHTHLRQHALPAFTHSVLKCLGVNTRLAERPELLCKDLVLLAGRQVWIRLERHPGHGIIGNGFDLRGPEKQALILGIVFLPGIDVAQGMDPAPVMRT